MSGEASVPIVLRERRDPEFPEEVAAVAAAKAELNDSSPLEHGLKTGILTPGRVVVAEVAPTLRCTEDCPGCPDRISILRKSKAGPENKADIGYLKEQMGELEELGVRHIMNVGGTIDKFEGLDDLIETQLELGLSISWFTDGIPQIEEDGTPTDLLEENLKGTWLSKVATHVSTDYAFGHEGIATGDLLTGTDIKLPTKRGRQGDFREDPEHSRVFKSQYGPVLMKRLIDKGVRRVVSNMTISAANYDQIEEIYRQAVVLQEYAESIGSPTEVMWTFSPWTWRSHQARGDDPAANSPEGALDYEHMPEVNRALQAILDDTYLRIEEGRPRVLANSSGYTSLHAESTFWREAVEQDIPYPHGRPLILNVNPAAEIMLDPMFKGPELAHVRHTFGYMDRTFDPTANPFVDFQHGNHPYLPNLIAVEDLASQEAQPQPMMDRRLAKWVVGSNVIRFGANMRNKSDSPSTMGDPRRLGSDPLISRYIGERFAHIVRNEIGEDADTLAGLMSFGAVILQAASIASLDDPLSRLRYMYVKLEAETHKGKQRIEGNVDRDLSQVVLGDDLRFHGTTSTKALDILKEEGFKNVLPHLLFIIDRQLQRIIDGPSQEDNGITIHSLLTMDEIANYMIETGDSIGVDQLTRMIFDYNLHERHDMPGFAQNMDEKIIAMLKSGELTIEQLQKILTEYERVVEDYNEKFELPDGTIEERADLPYWQQQRAKLIARLQQEQLLPA